MERQAIAFRPELNESHKYAVGVMIEKGGFCPMQSYPDEQKLQEGYSMFLRIANSLQVHKPIIVERTEFGLWEDSTCLVRRDLMQRGDE